MDVGTTLPHQSEAAASSSHVDLNGLPMEPDASPGSLELDRPGNPVSKMMHQQTTSGTESQMFVNPSEVLIDGVNTFTSAGGSVYNIHPALTVSLQHEVASASISPVIPLAPSSSQLSGTVDLRIEREPEHDSEVYARLLLPKKLGWPLWLPRPRNGLPDCYRRKGVSIGDVGIITTNGEFDFLFNICHPADDPINRNRVPENFQPIDPPLDFDEDVTSEPDAWKAGDYVLNGSIQEQGLMTTESSNTFSFECSPSEGAISVLPGGGSRQDLLITVDFHDYAGQHAESWYKFVNAPRRAGGLGRGVSNGALYLITGVDKTSSWGTGSFTGVAGNGTFPLQFRKAGSDAREANYSFVWCQSGLAATKHGPMIERFDGEPGLPENQCTFLRGFRVALSETLWASLFRPIEVRSILDAKPSSLLNKSQYIPFGNGASSGLSSYFGFGRGSWSTSPRDAEGDGGAIVVPDFPAPSPTLHPSDAINSFLLSQDPSARVAITHDNLWCSAVEDGATTLPSTLEILDRISSSHTRVSRNGVTSFVPNDTVDTKKKYRRRRLSVQSTTSSILSVDAPVTISTIRPKYPGSTRIRRLRPIANRTHDGGSPRKTRSHRGVSDLVPIEPLTPKATTLQSKAWSTSQPDLTLSRRKSLLGDIYLNVEATPPSESFRRESSETRVASSRSETDVSTTLVTAVSRSGSVDSLSSSQDTRFDLLTPLPTKESPCAPRKFSRRFSSDISRPASLDSSFLVNRAEKNGREILKFEQDKGTRRIQIGVVMEKGASELYRALDLNTGTMLLVRRISIKDIKAEQVPTILKQLEPLKKLSHPNIAKFEGAVQAKDTLNIVHEYMSNGSLAQTLKAFGKLNERLVASYVTRILDGLHYLHGMGITHFNLKASNIWTTRNGTIKLTDYEIWNTLSSKDELVSMAPNWMAPEIIELKGASPKSDIWSLGCTILELLTGHPPYSEISNPLSVMFRIVEDDRPPLPEGCSPLLEAFLVQCFNKDVEERSDTTRLLRHTWLKNQLRAYQIPEGDIPSLRRVSVEPRGRDTLGIGFPSAAVAHPTPNSIQDVATKEHSFVKTTFGKPMMCRVCQLTIKRSAVLCETCSLIAHSKCTPNAPATCDLRSQLLLYASYGEASRVSSLDQAPKESMASPGSRLKPLPDRDYYKPSFRVSGRSTASTLVENGSPDQQSEARFSRKSTTSTLVESPADPPRLPGKAIHKFPLRPIPRKPSTPGRETTPTSSSKTALKPPRTALEDRPPLQASSARASQSSNTHRQRKDNLCIIQ